MIRALLIALLLGPASAFGAGLESGGCVEGGAADAVASACYAVPTDRYGHGVFGQAPGEPGEWAALRVRFRDGRTATVTLPETAVFEDVAPRLVDVDGDGARDLVTVEADRAAGAALVVYRARDGAVTRLAATPPIGARNRWLAPAGAADFNGDGRIDLVYVDRPHLKGVLRFVTLDGDRLVPLRFPGGSAMAHRGVSNHRFGARTIPGGVRDCGEGPEIVLASFDWTRIIGVRVARDRILTRWLPGPTTDAGLLAALSCPQR